MNSIGSLNLDNLLQEALDKTSKEAAEWAVSLPREDFDKVILLMYRQYKTFVEKQQQGIEDFFGIYPGLLDLPWDLKGALTVYLTDCLLESKEELTNV